VAAVKGRFGLADRTRRGTFRVFVRLGLGDVSEASEFVVPRLPMGRRQCDERTEMAKVYTVAKDGNSRPLEQVHCRSESSELQLILEKNPDLLPGDQIDPDDPRRWLLIKREMPVPDPSTGTDRWSVDMFFVDQDAKPTFVECKRFKDTRSRREVVGQVLEYAANAGHYWTKEQLRDYAEETARLAGQTLEESLQSLGREDAEVDEFFEQVQQNLREKQVRLIFFLEESPVELRSLVDFLNEQMERSDVLLVEAGQFAHGDGRLVVPILYGYTPRARQVKRTVTVKTKGARKKWDHASFFEDARDKVGGDGEQALRRLHDACVDVGCEISWGTGVARGSFSAKEEAISQRSVITGWSDGTLTFNVGWLGRTEKERAFRDQFREQLVSRMGIDIPVDCDRRFPKAPLEQWRGLLDELVGIMESLVGQHRGAET